MFVDGHEKCRCDYDSSIQIKEHGKIDLEFYKYHVGKGRGHWKIRWFVILWISERYM